MLRLRKVEIAGFKSFADRTRIVFNGSGVAGVVGPNGCGKSNIADAILWVLGEQSAKTLRSSRMADCIFNGTANRPPTNLAEVTLTMVDPEAEAAPAEPPVAPVVEAAVAQAPEAAPEGEKKSDAARKNRLNLRILPGEVVVTRRLYRDGTSEYYLNGELCRLRDIQELFMGTGLGPESYAIIEQGRIGQILSSRPSDRRALLEEAAGVTKYKTKRRLAEARLESARQNLLRVNDILEEIVKQLNSLKRQASRARRYQELKTEGTGLRRRLLATQLDALHQGEAAVAAQLEANAAELARASADLAALEQEQTAAQSRQYELETSLRQEQNQAGQALVELERAQTRRADTRRQQDETARNLEALAARAQTRQAEAAAAAEQLEQNRVQLAALEEEFAAAAAGLTERTTEFDALRRQIVEIEAAQQQRQARQSEELNRRAADGAEVAKLEQLVASAEEQSQRAAAEEEVAGQQRQRAADELGRLESSLAQARAERNRAQENANAAERALAQAQQDLQVEQQRIDELRRSLAQAVAQQQTLQELVAHRAALAEPVQKLLVTNGGSTTEVEFRSVGVVADFVRFEPAYAPLLEDYLHDEMEYVVVETYDAARSGVSMLREQMVGRATFLVDSFGRFPPKLAEEATTMPEGTGLIGSVAEMVHMNGALGAEAKRVLPKLGRTFLVESPRAGEGLAREYPQYFFLAPDGTCYHGRLVSGGARNGYGSHALERELKQAGERRGQLEPQAASAETEVSRLDSRRRQLERLLETARQTLFAQEKNLLQIDQQVQALVAERDRQESLRARAAEERASSQARRQTLATQLDELRAALARGEGERSALEETLLQSTQSLQDARQQAETTAAALADLRARHAALEERLAALRQERVRLEETAARLAADEQAETERQAHLLAEQTRLAEELTTREQEILVSQQAKLEQEERCVALAAELDAVRRSLTERETALREHRAGVDAVRESRHGLEVERVRQESERQHLAAAVQSEFGLTAEQLAAEVTDRLTGPELAEAETRYAEIKQRLDNIGAVNMMALEELEECDERHQFLTKQREDLLASIADTTNAITEIDTVSRQQFEAAFAVINENFVGMFRTLFGGGTATLRLTDAENPDDSGVDLICQPPGKRLQNVLLLSGGEKALVAIALLMAVFRYSPSPFCVLDEVDAPLDDTNVGRFNRLIAEMSSQTQFIIVTHNKKTMEIASLLYGVTMQSAVSQVVSVRFDEAAATAA